MREKNSFPPFPGRKNSNPVFVHSVKCPLKAQIVFGKKKVCSSFMQSYVYKYHPSNQSRIVSMQPPDLEMCVCEKKKKKKCICTRRPK